jgi:MraZ protein
MDGQGRLLMPQLLRDAAQIKGEVAVTGQSDLPGSTQPRSVSKEIEDEKFTPEDEKTLDELGI